MRRVFCALALLGFAACLDFGSLGGGDDGVKSDDAATDPLDAFADDGSPDDSGFLDVVTPPLIDASFCAQSDASFCDDFDTVPLAVRWTSRGTRAGGTIDTEAFASSPSPPNSLYAMLPDAGPGTEYTRNAIISRVFSGTFTHFDVGFDIYLEKIDTDPGFGAVLPLAIYSPNLVPKSPSYLTFYYWQNQAYATEQHDFPDGGETTLNSPPWFDFPKVGKWQRLELAIDLAGDGGTPYLTVTLDGAIVEHFAMSKAWALGPTIALQLGITYAYGTLSPWKIRYDNVTVNTR